MSDFPQVMSTKKLTDVIELIPEIGVPSQVDKKFLQENGYTSSHDLKLLAPLKYIGLVENKARGGAPTDLWKEARGDLASAVGKGVKQGYAALFEKYPNAHLRDQESLTNFFKANTDQSADSARRMADKFLALCEISSFEAQQENTNQNDTGHVVEPTTHAAQSSSTQSDENASKLSFEAPGLPAVTINIELQVPSDPSGEVYENFSKLCGNISSKDFEIESGY
ncbi:DUF5343 domain-containing protein [Ruegeria arenilitoris]|uniref:DUF5343 domain-containing protein n=1 Tax=Ruegeria arenilitoris TaxID=1173585 RepID=UPI00147A3C47|nr:DUF5343 domain-containing protein [Ruegeria arenilitoris]